MDDAAVGSDDEFADDAFMVKLDAFGETIDITTELRTVALPVPVTAATQDNTILVGFAGRNRPGVTFAPFLGSYLIDGFQTEKEGCENGKTSQCPLPSFVVAAEVCGHDE